MTNTKFADGFLPFPLLSTPRLHLRALAVDDFAFQRAMVLNPLVNRYLGREIESEEVTRQRLERIIGETEKGNAIVWLLELPEGKIPIGTAGLWRIDRQHNLADIGYTLSPDYWGQ